MSNISTGSIERGVTAVLGSRRSAVGLTLVILFLVCIALLGYLAAANSGIRRTAEIALHIYFWVCLFGTLGTTAVFLALRSRAKSRFGVPAPPPFVSIVIPAFNEEEKIAQALDAAIKQDYPRFEVIVVDDGSRDYTRFVAETFPIRTVRREENVGKCAALNAGVAAAVGSIIVTSDSDSFLDPDALRHLVPHFDDPDVGAVAGVVRPISTIGLVRQFQNIEYIWSQEIMKLAQVGSGSSVTVCPGPISAFRRSVLEEIGGFKPRTITEDFDMTLEIIGARHKVLFEPRALSLTDTPANWRRLSKQRLRWHRGTLQTFWLQRSMFLAPSHGSVGLFWLPYLLFAAYGSLIVDLAALAVIPTLVASAGAPWELVLQGFKYIVIVEVAVVAQYLLALVAAGETRASLYRSAFLMKAFNVFLAWSRLKSAYIEIRGSSVTW